MRFLVGAYTADRGGAATGIGMLYAGGPDDRLAGGALSFAGDVVRADSPSWIAAHPTLDVVYAALEERGVVQAYRRTGEESWTALGTAVPAGEAVCHVVTDGSALIATCWGDGRVVRMPLDAEGRPGHPVIAPAASDPYGADAATSTAGDLDLAAAARALRKAAGAEFAHLVPDHDEPAAEEPADGRPSRAHQAVLLGGGRVATTDVGLDLVRFWSGARSVGEVVLPQGSGPRHAVFHPSGHLYVLTEDSCEVFVLAPDAAGEWRLVSGAQLGALPGDTGVELAASRDGSFLYAGLRGSDTIATLRVRGTGDALAPVALVEAGVGMPRHHVVARDMLLVAGQGSDEVVSLTLDERTGVPGRVRHRTSVPTPTCLLPLR